MDEWVELFVTYDEIEAQIVKNILEAEDIQVVLNSLKVRPYPVSIGKIGEVKLLVKKENLENAKNIIKIMKNVSSIEGTNDY
ncbi:MAG: DUF2007 domain-containing protein [Candidatus Mariimomonas ferrooxydans]